MLPGQRRQLGRLRILHNEARPPVRSIPFLVVGQPDQEF